MESMPGSPTDGQQSSDPNIIRCGPVFMDLEGFKVTANGHNIRLTLAEFLILAALARHPYQAFDRQALTAALKQHGPPFANIQGTGRSMDVHIFRLRHKLRQADCDCIKTMKFVGYRFIPDETSSAQASPT